MACARGMVGKNVCCGVSCERLMTEAGVMQCCLVILSLLFEKMSDHSYWSHHKADNGT